MASPKISKQLHHPETDSDSDLKMDTPFPTFLVLKSTEEKAITIISPY